MSDSDFERLEQTVRRAVEQIDTLRGEKAELENRLKSRQSDKKSRLTAVDTADPQAEKAEEAVERIRGLIARLREFEQEL